MNCARGKYRREALRFGAIAGLLSVMLLLPSRPVQAATSSQDQVSKDFQQTVTLGAGQSVRIEHKFGSIRLHGEPGREVKISATIHAQASSHEEAESFAQAKECVSRRSIPTKKKAGFISASTLRGR
jgi:hypothetical protein